MRPTLSQCFPNPLTRQWPSTNNIVHCECKQLYSLVSICCCVPKAHLLVLTELEEEMEENPLLSSHETFNNNNNNNNNDPNGENFNSNFNNFYNFNNMENVNNNINMISCMPKGPKYLEYRINKKTTVENFQIFLWRAQLASRVAPNNNQNNNNNQKLTTVASVALAASRRSRNEEEEDNNNNNNNNNVEPTGDEETEFSPREGNDDDALNKSTRRPRNKNQNNNNNNKYQKQIVVVCLHGLMDASPEILAVLHDVLFFGQLEIKKTTNMSYDDNTNNNNNDMSVFTENKSPTLTSPGINNENNKNNNNADLKTKYEIRRVPAVRIVAYVSQKRYALLLPESLRSCFAFSLLLSTLSIQSAIVLQHERAEVSNIIHKQNFFELINDNFENNHHMLNNEHSIIESVNDIPSTVHRYLLHLLNIIIGSSVVFHAPGPHILAEIPKIKLLLKVAAVLFCPEEEYFFRNASYTNPYSNQNLKIKNNNNNNNKKKNNKFSDSSSDSTSGVSNDYAQYHTRNPIYFENYDFSHIIVTANDVLCLLTHLITHKLTVYKEMIFGTPQTIIYNKNNNTFLYNRRSSLSHTALMRPSMENNNNNSPSHLNNNNNTGNSVSMNSNTNQNNNNNLLTAVSFTGFPRENTNHNFSTTQQNNNNNNHNNNHNNNLLLSSHPFDVKLWDAVVVLQSSRAHQQLLLKQNFNKSLEQNHNYFNNNNNNNIHFTNRNFVFRNGVQKSTKSKSLNEENSNYNNNNHNSKKKEAENFPFLVYHVDLDDNNFNNNNNRKTSVPKSRFLSDKNKETMREWLQGDLSIFSNNNSNMNNNNINNFGNSPPTTRHANLNKDSDKDFSSSSSFSDSETQNYFTHTENNNNNKNNESFSFNFEAKKADTLFGFASFQNSNKEENTKNNNNNNASTVKFKNNTEKSILKHKNNKHNPNDHSLLSLNSKKGEFSSLIEAQKRETKNNNVLNYKELRNLMRDVILSFSKPAPA